jgi:FkbM family methyltransferase
MKAFFRSLKMVLSTIYPPVKYTRLSFSQEGEDLLLYSFYEGEPEYKGFYIDIGAHHPFRFSNTYLYYLKDWQGINVDAMPGSMQLFQKYRKRDINLEIGVGKKKGRTYFYCFSEPAFNTFNEDLALRRAGKNGCRLTEKVSVEIMSLEDILDLYLPPNRKIDFISIDVESLDFDVLSSNNWKKYRPRFILVEATENEGEDKISTYLTTVNYHRVARSQRTMIFEDCTTT